MDSADETAFRDLVATRSTALLRFAYLVVGDPVEAEDLLQTALVKTYLAWSRIRDPGAVDAYVRRIIATTATSWWRSRQRRPQPVGYLPERTDSDQFGPWTERDAMWSALVALPARQRAVLVLRYYEDLSEIEIAETLGIARGSVKSHASRGLATLRQRLANDETNLGVRT
ncbi:MAG: SigE family RNA polymerase sigma factor [Sporichthyaceae bacterium]|nr:SigE family RNA polymerase sigma factor [Sporichthyaceae bacterium]